MKKLTKALVVALMAGLMVISGETGAFAAELCVNPGGTGGCYSSIKAAITAAGTGDTILVEAGTYSEAITINKANLTLQSETELGAIIRPTANCTAVINISADGVTVDGFEIDGTTVANNGIFGWETSGLTIKNNKIHGAVRTWDGCGILLMSWGNSGTVFNNLIENNEVYDTGRMGIMICDFSTELRSGYWPGYYTVTSGNTITGNTVHDVWKKAKAWNDGGGGIQINVGKNSSITNNLVYDVKDGTDPQWDQKGIFMFGSAAGNTITGNTLRNNGVGIKVWISGEQTPAYIYWGSETPTSPAVHYNNIYDNSFYGATSSNPADTTPMVLDATNNWWGDKRGPSRAMGEAKGHDEVKGDRVSPNVSFAPWLKNEAP